MAKGKKVHWTPEMDAIVGALSDADAGRLLNVHTESVRIRRLLLGKPAYYTQNQPVKWTDEMDKMIGTDTDRNIAALLSVGCESVQARRQSLGKHAFAKRVKVNWTTEMDAILGTMSDRAASVLLGVSHALAFKRRIQICKPQYMIYVTCASCGNIFPAPDNCRVNSHRWCLTCRHASRISHSSIRYQKRKLAKDMNKIAEAIDKHEKKDS